MPLKGFRLMRVPFCHINGKYLYYCNIISSMEDKKRSWRKKTIPFYLCSANNWVTCGKNRVNWIAPFESSSSVAEIISFISFSDGTHPVITNKKKFGIPKAHCFTNDFPHACSPKYRKIVPISRTSTVLLPKLNYIFFY